MQRIPNTGAGSQELEERELEIQNGVKGRDKESKEPDQLKFLLTLERDSCYNEKQWGRNEENYHMCFGSFEDLKCLGPPH
jgi:hypothetical protein